MKYPAARVLVLSKAPVPGRVKTRLIPHLGKTQATEFYRSLVERTLTTLSEAELCPVELWCAPDMNHPFFAECAAQYGVSLQSQCDGNLGARMAHAMATGLQRADQVVLVGCDCPSLCGNDIEQAISGLLNGCDVVLGPATDGGYYLVGSTRPQVALFADIDWGTAKVLETTLVRCAHLGLKTQLLAEHADIDTAADYIAWQQRKIVSA